MISGGQTGVDRAALDAAMQAGLPVGGWCPKGRRAEDGPIAERYPLRETPTRAYAERTAWNVRDSDGTLVLLPGAAQGGTALTVREAKRRGKPVLALMLKAPAGVKEASAWLVESKINILNVAGPRESEAPGVYQQARLFLERLFKGGGLKGQEW